MDEGKLNQLEESGALLSDCEPETPQGEEHLSMLGRIERALNGLVGDKLKAHRMLFAEDRLFNIRLGLARGALESGPDSLTNAIYAYGQACALVGMASVVGDLELIRATQSLGRSIGARVEVLLLDIGALAVAESLHGEEQE